MSSAPSGLMTSSNYQHNASSRNQRRVSFGGEKRKALEDISNVKIPTSILQSGDKQLPPPAIKNKHRASTSTTLASASASSILSISSSMNALAISPSLPEPSSSSSASPRTLRPQSVVALFGMPRAGSAWLFNAARLLMRLQGSDVRADWDSGFGEKYGSGDFSKAMERLKLIGVSALIKSLSCTEEIMAWSDKSFLCIRDVRQAVYSDMEHKQTLDAPPADWLKRAHGFIRMCNISESAALSHPGHMFRMSYEELLKNPSAMLMQAAAHLGIPKLPSDDTESGVEHLSRALDLENDKDIKGLPGIQVIERDPDCRRWLLTHGYML